MAYEASKIYMTQDPNARLFYRCLKVYPEVAIFERVGDGTANTHKVADLTDNANPFLFPATADALEKQRAIFLRDRGIHAANLANVEDYLAEFDEAIASIPADAPVEEPPAPVDDTNPTPDPDATTETTEPAPEPAPETTEG